MSLMAGFDIVLEFSNAAVLRLFEANFNIGSGTANPPFDLDLGLAHIIVTDLQLDLLQNDVVRLTIFFNDSSVTSPLLISPLDGSFSIDVHILNSVRTTGDTTSGSNMINNIGTLQGVAVGMAIVGTGIPGGATVSAVAPPSAITISQNATSTGVGVLLTITGSDGRPVLNFPGVQAGDIQLNLSLASQSIVQKAGVPEGLFENIAKSAIQNFISMQPAFGPVPNGISLVPGVDGSYSASGVQVERVEAHCIPNQDRLKQSLAICGILLAAHDGNGNFALRTTSVIAPGDDACISIAPQAFHSLIACPALRDSLLTGDKKSTMLLPPTCGFFDLNNAKTFGVTIKSITDGFADGHIDLNASGHGSPMAGVNIDASVHATITPRASNGEIIADIRIDPPSVSVSLDWWAWFLAAIAGPIGLAFAGIFDAMFTNVIQTIASSLPSVFNNEELGFGVPDVLVDQVNTTTEGLTVSGKLQSASIPIPTPRVRGIHLSGSVVDQSVVDIKSGTLHLTTGCPQGDYPYIEESQQQQGNYEVLSSLMGYPMKLDWSIGVGNTVVPLAGANGNVTVQVDSWYPFAPSVTQKVTISYAIDPSPALTIHLQNVPSDGNYRVWLVVQATDPLNNVAYAGVEVDFEGDHFKMLGSYSADLYACMKRLREEILKARPFQSNIPPWVPVDHPAPDTLANFVRAVAAVGGPQASQLLGQLRLAHGFNFDRAVLSVQRAPAASGFAPGMTTIRL